MSDDGEHSRLSASGAPGWSRCLGKIEASKGIEEKPSRYAAEGTVAHTIAAEMLAPWVAKASADPLPPSAFVGATYHQDGFEFKIDQEFAEHVQTYVDEVIACVPEGAICYVETKVNYAELLGVDIPEKDAWGTSDFIWVHGRRIGVHDLKFGMGVKVWASWTEIIGDPICVDGVELTMERPNEQALCYGAGALLEAELLTDIDTIELHIHQPRLDHHDEFTLTKDELLWEIRELGRQALLTYPTAGYTPPLTPSEKQCKFCLAKPCEALRRETALALTNNKVASVDDFEDETKPLILNPKAISALSDERLGEIMDAEELIEMFMAGIRAEVDRRVLSGRDVPSPKGGYMVGVGKQGDRKWHDEAKALSIARKAGATDETLYAPRKLKSPNQMETVLKKLPGGKAAIEQIKVAYSRTPGKPHVTLRAPGVVEFTRSADEGDFDDESGASHSQLVRDDEVPAHLRARA